MGVIYKITNKINGLIYIGQTTDMKRRLKEYKNGSKKLNKHRNYMIMQEMYKYGFDNFEFEIIEYNIPLLLLNSREIFWIDKLQSRNSLIGYNSKTGGKGGELTEISKHKMAESSKNFKHTDEEKLKRSISIITINIDTLQICKYQSAKVFADIFNTNRSVITSAIRKGKNIYNHYIFYDDPELCNLTVNNIINIKSNQNKLSVKSLKEYLSFYEKVKNNIK